MMNTYKRHRFPPDIISYTSTGERYLSKIYNDEWMRENRLLVADAGTAEEMVLRKSGAIPALIAVETHSDVRAALELMEKHSISQLPVLDGNECVGVISESTLMARLVRDPELIDGPIEPLMEAALPVVDASADFETVTRMLVGGQSAVLVRGDGKPDGIITRHDVVRYLTGFGP